MTSSLNVSVLDKHTFISKLPTILMETFKGEDYEINERLVNLVNNLRNEVWFVSEYPYVDRHYRDTYYSFYSSKFKEINRYCIRVHIFNGEVTKNDFLSTNSNLPTKEYWGFFIVRPIVRHTLGRSLISPKAFKINNFVCCLTKDRVSLLGNEFTVYGFPHVSQDTETHTCAESSLWSLIEYFGSKHREYKQLLPSQIMKTLLDNTEHRLLPSEGLTENELAKCLQNNGFQCKIYSCNAHTRKIIPFKQILQMYIESGIPVLLKLESKFDGHAVIAIGHEDDDAMYNIDNHVFLTKHDAPWEEVSQYLKKLVFIDDNLPPYQIATISEPTANYSDSRFQNMRITHFIVPLPVRVFLVAEKAYALMKVILNENRLSLKETHEKWITRLLLTSTHSFKIFINKIDTNLADSLKKELLHLLLPRFIWICELYRTDNYIKDGGHSSGLLIIDSTSDGKTLASVLWYTIDNRKFTHDGIVWDEEYTPIETFKMNTYRNNLKGDWNKWEN